MLLLFVAFFTVILVVGAYAMDQGLWLARRSHVQGAADAAARSGAQAQLPGPSAGAPCDVAGDTADANLVPVAAPGSCASAANCAPLQSAGTGLPSTEVKLSQTTTALFSRAFGILGIDVQAKSTACYGSITELIESRAAQDVPVRRGMPFVLVNRTAGAANANANNCFDAAGQLRLGRACTILGAIDAPPTPAPGMPRTRAFWLSPGAASCRRPGSVPAGQVKQQTRDGNEFDCQTNTAGGACTGLNCVRALSANTDVSNDLQNRLSRATNCDRGPDSASFQAAFGFANGRPAAALGPAPDLGTDPSATTYVQNDCFDNPRIVVLPIVGNISNGETDRAVLGFATVYLLGCTDQSAPLNGSVSRPTCNVPNGNPGRQYELRGVPVHVYYATGVPGGIVKPVNNAPLTIQTVD